MSDEITVKSQLYVTIEHACVAGKLLTLNAILNDGEYTCCPKCGRRWRRVGEEVGEPAQEVRGHGGVE